MSFKKIVVDQSKPFPTNKLRLEEDELREIHNHFRILRKLIKRKNLIFILDSDLTQKRQKEEYENKIEFYFVEIYKFIIAYEGIFKHLWEKERKLSRKLRKTSKRL